MKTISIAAFGAVSRQIVKHTLPIPAQKLIFGFLELKNKAYLCSMIELSRHIESLLLHHDCVIVPGLGGFVTQYVPARRIEEEFLFLPPYRSVGFNQQLVLNDGLLVQSYMKAYGTSYPDTLKLIDSAVRELKEELQEKGEYELSGIGTLSMGIGEQYNFTPCKAGVVSPELYGLDSLSLKRWDAKANNAADGEQPAERQKKLQVKRTEKNYTISISREIVNYAAAAVVAVFFYFVWATPVSNSTSVDTQAASVVYEQLFSNVQTNSQTIIPKPVPVAEPKSVPATTETSAAEPTVSKTETTSKQPVAVAAKPTGKFTLVLASAVPNQSAEKYVQKLKDEGFKHADLYVNGRMVRVINGHYATETEAQHALQQFKKHKAFADAWVLKLK